MGNENMLDFLELDLEFSQLQLRSFPTVDKEQFIVNADKLSRRRSFKSRSGRATAENGNLKVQSLIVVYL